MADRLPLIRATAMPGDLNPYGGVFGGWIFSLMGLGAGSAASRRTKAKAVLVAADELRFTGAPALGDEVSVYAEVEREGRTSLTYAVEVWARERHGEEEMKVASGRLKFVALDDEDKPREFTKLENPSPLPSPSRGEGVASAQ